PGRAGDGEPRGVLAGALRRRRGAEHPGPRRHVGRRVGRVLPAAPGPGGGVVKPVKWLVMFKVDQYICTCSVDTEEEARDLASRVDDPLITATYDVVEAMAGE